MKQNNHNTHFYSIQEVERCLKSTEEFEDGEQLFYFIGALRYVYDENKKKDKQIERLNNTIHEIEEYTHERIKLYKKRLKFPFYHPMRTLHNIWLYEKYLSKLKKLKGGKNDKEF